MHYRITITEVAEKEVLKSVYIGDDSSTKYANKLVTEEVEKEIYAQSVDKLALEKVIAVINGI